MELKIVLNSDERELLQVEQAEYTEADALHLLFDATKRLQLKNDHLLALRGNTPGTQGQFNKTWHENVVLNSLVEGLERFVNARQSNNL